VAGVRYPGHTLITPIHPSAWKRFSPKFLKTGPPGYSHLREGV
jgi:hypothetical protein